MARLLAAAAVLIAVVPCLASEPGQLVPGHHGGAW